MAQTEKPEVKALTHGVTQRPSGLGFDETAGMSGAASILEAAAAGEVRDGGLHAAGETCSRCGRIFTEDTPVRRNAAREWIHDVCPG